ncbi:unnamed protein product [Prunus armeniaca]
MAQDQEHEFTTSKNQVKEEEEEKRSSGMSNQVIEEEEDEKSFAMNNRDHDKSNNGGHEKTEKVAFLKLFWFADKADVMLMLVGTIGAMANGSCMPIITMLVREMSDCFGTNQNNTHIILSVVSKEHTQEVLAKGPPMPKLGWVFVGKPDGRSRVWWLEPCVKERKNMAARVLRDNFCRVSVRI